MYLQNVFITSLGPSWRRLGTIVANHGAILGRTGSSLASLEAPRPSQKTINFICFSILFEIFDMFEFTSALDASGRVFVASWNDVTVILAASWCHLGPSWRHLVPSWPRLDLPKPFQNRSKMHNKINLKIDRKSKPT